MSSCKLFIELLFDISYEILKHNKEKEYVSGMKLSY